MINKLLAALAVTCLSFGASAATVTYSSILDANSSPLYFDVGTTVPDGGDGNILHIGLSAFTADSGTVFTLSATDTLFFNVAAPLGYKITKLTYTETGSGLVTGVGAAVATGSVVANGDPNGLGLHIFLSGDDGSWSLSTFYDYSASVVTSVDMSIFNSLFAIAAPGDLASVTKGSATMVAELTAIPLPTSVWLLGSALVGGVAVARRKAAAQA